MREIAGEKYKLAGFDVYQKGTLVDVFAKFCGVNETIEQILAEDAAPEVKKPSTAKPGTGAALLEGTLAAIECTIVARYPAGDHTIVVGEVIAATANLERPLLYYRGGYAQLER